MPSLHPKQHKDIGVAIEVYFNVFTNCHLRFVPSTSEPICSINHIEGPDNNPA